MDTAAATAAATAATAATATAHSAVTTAAVAAAGSTGSVASAVEQRNVAVLDSTLHKARGSAAYTQGALTVVNGFFTKRGKKLFSAYVLHPESWTPPQLDCLH
eukprot:3682-Heterococcus_DN1.PRE.1